MKLLADAMLGRLARWLRIMGYDTAYIPDTDDFAVMGLARAEDRLILTRDRALAERRGFRTLLIESESLERQVLQVWAAAGPPPDVLVSRCSVCNYNLVEAEPEMVSARVPPYVQKTHEHFSLCGACGRIYWQGTHWQRMRALVAKLHDEAGFDTIE